MIDRFEVLETGTCIAFGGTNARVGQYVEGDVINFHSTDTPPEPKDFFAWMTREVLEASGRGDSWVVAGFPGPVTSDGTMVGPMENVPGLRDKRYNIADEMIGADPAFKRLLDEEFTLIAVNDGELSAQAAALKIGEEAYDRVADIIFGTGVGAGIVHRDRKISAVYRADRSSPAEIGHLMLGADPQETFETTLSGPALEKRYGIPPEKMTAVHPAMEKVGKGAGQLAMILGLMHGAELVVISGGVGANASNKYGPYLEELIKNYSEKGNGAQKLYLPEIVPVPPQDAQIFELFGAEGVMRDFLTRDS